jgi:hypothetical protein
MVRRFLLLSGALWAYVVLLVVGSLSMRRHVLHALPTCATSAQAAACHRATLIFPVSIAVLLVLALTTQVLAILVHQGRVRVGGLAAFSWYWWSFGVLLALGVMQFEAVDRTQAAQCAAELSNDAWSLCFDFSSIEKGITEFVAVATIVGQLVAVGVASRQRRSRRQEAPESGAPRRTRWLATLLPLVVTAVVVSSLGAAIVIKSASVANGEPSVQLPAQQTELSIQSLTLFGKAGRAHLLARLRAFDGVRWCRYVGQSLIGMPARPQEVFDCETKPGGPGDGWGWRMDLAVRAWPGFDVGIS